jgi:hypothetical protein
MRNGVLDNSSALTCGNGMVKVQELGFSLDHEAGQRKEQRNADATQTPWHTGIHPGAATVMASVMPASVHDP